MAQALCGWLATQIDIGAFEHAIHAMTIHTGDDGGGTITIEPGGIDCGAACTHDFLARSTVKVIATADPGSTFASWSGDCSGTAAEILVAVEEDMTCTAIFTANATPDPTATPTATEDNNHGMDVPDKTATPDTPDHSDDDIVPDDEPGPEPDQTQFAPYLPIMQR